jgi:Family of unknown function (DUF6328)
MAADVHAPRPCTLAFSRPGPGYGLHLKGRRAGTEDQMTTEGMTDDRQHAGLSRRTLNRNWDELLQELRAAQTGVQILTGFLLTVPFSSRFSTLMPSQRWLYMAVLAGAVTATCLILAPVAFHRLLFRRGRRLLLVETANRLALAGLGALLLTICGMVFLVADVVIGPGGASLAAALAIALFVVLWVAAPLGLARSGRFPKNRPPDAPVSCGRPGRDRTHA